MYDGKGSFKIKNCEVVPKFSRPRPVPYAITYQKSAPYFTIHYTEPPRNFIIIVDDKQL